MWPHLMLILKFLLELNILNDMVRCRVVNSLWSFGHFNSQNPMHIYRQNFSMNLSKTQIQKVKVFVRISHEKRLNLVRSLVWFLFHTIRIDWLYSYHTTYMLVAAVNNSLIPLICTINTRLMCPPITNVLTGVCWQLARNKVGYGEYFTF